MGESKEVKQKCRNFLTKAETHIKFFPLRNDTKYNDLFTNYLKNAEALAKNEIDFASEFVEDNSIPQTVEIGRLKKKRGRSDSMSTTPKGMEFVIIIDKSVLKEHKVD